MDLGRAHILSNFVLMQSCGDLLTPSRHHTPKEPEVIKVASMTTSKARQEVQSCPEFSR